MREVLDKMKYRYLILGSVVILIISLLIGFLLHIDSYINANTSVHLAFYGFPIAWIFYNFYKNKISNRVWIKSTRLKVGEIIGGVIFPEILGVGILVLIMAILSLLNPIGGQGETTNSQTNWTIAILSACVIAPVCGEIIFRGFILNKLLLKVSHLKAVIISSVIFGAMHLTKGISPTIIGVILCIMYMKYKSLIPGMVVHCLHNIGVVLIKYLTFGNMDGRADVSQLNPEGLFILSGVFILIGLVWVVLFIKRNWKYVTDFEI